MCCEVLTMQSFHTAKKSAIERRWRGPKCCEANEQTHCSARCEGPRTLQQHQLRLRTQKSFRKPDNMICTYFQINEITTLLTDLLSYAANNLQVHTNSEHLAQHKHILQATRRWITYSPFLRAHVMFRIVA